MSSTKRAEVTIIKQILIRLKPIVQDSVISRQSAVITINQQSPISSRPQHTVSAVSPQHQMLGHNISCQPAASAVRSQYQLSAHNISCQPAAPTISYHQSSSVIVTEPSATRKRSSLISHPQPSSYQPSPTTSQLLTLVINKD